MNVWEGGVGGVGVDVGGLYSRGKVIPPTVVGGSQFEGYLLPLLQPGR